MKNKKLLKTLAALTVSAVAAVGCLGFAACGDDHEHKYDENKWVSAGADGHYHVCTVDGCDEHSEIVAHEYDDDKDDTCNKCDYKRTISGGNQGGSTQATAHTNTYSYATIPVKTTDKTVLTQADFTGDNAFLTVANEKVTYRTSAGCIEVKEGGLTVTFQGTGKITIGFSSTGKAPQTSGLALVKADGTYVDGVPGTGAAKLAADDDAQNKAGLITAQGTSASTVEFTVTEAGTYTIYCMYSYADASKPTGFNSRGARIHSIVMVDNY